jgi:leucyl aminopeptidase (aminopeptidase T)
MLQKRWRIRISTPLFAALFALVPALALAEATGKATPMEIAKKLVVQSANIKQKEIVFLNGGPNNIELLDALAIEVQKAGAVPVVTVNTEARIRRMWEEVPAATDAIHAETELKLVNVMNSSIEIDFVEHPGFLSTIPPERMAARNKAFQPVSEASLKRGIKSVSLGNGLYPTDALAKRFGITKDQLAEIFWNGVNVDYATLQATGEAVSKMLARGKELTLTNPNGTDIKMRIEGRQNFASDGVISDADAKKGGPACLVWLPAGEVYLTPVPGTAEGKVVIDRSYFQDTEILGLTFTIKGGKVTSMTAKSGLEPLKAHYDAASAGKEDFSFVDVGINPKVTAPANSKFLSYVAAGTVTVGIGGNTWAGGTNDVAFGHHAFLPGSTLEVDGEALVEKGVLSAQVRAAML